MGGQKLYICVFFFCWVTSILSFLIDFNLDLQDDKKDIWQRCSTSDSWDE